MVGCPTDSRRRRPARSPARRPRARDRLRARRRGDPRLRAPRDGASDGRSTGRDDDRGGRPPNAEFVGAGRAEFLVAALEDVDLGERRFDVAFAVRVGLFRREPDRARELAARWLAPGGRVLAVFDPSAPADPAPGGSAGDGRQRSGSVNRPASRALPAIAPSQPRSRTATRSSSDATPPAAITGSPTATIASSSRSGPASEPSRCVLVTRSRGDARRGAALACSAAGVSEVSVQPLAATIPSRTSTATTIASPNRPTARSRKPRSSAAVPTITRSAPAAARGAIASSVR